MIAAEQGNSVRELALEWLGQGRRVVAATLVERIGSAPLDPGAEMVIDDRGRIEGTVTGGCVESALVGEAAESLTRTAGPIHTGAEPAEPHEKEAT